MKYLKLYETFLLSNPTTWIIGRNDDWEILIDKDGKYLVYRKGTFSTYSTQKEIMKNVLKDSSKYTPNNMAERGEYTLLVYQELYKLIEKLKSYEFQKKYLTKYPERFKDLEEFSYNEKIKEEFAWLFEGNEFGFFNLKN